MARPSRGDRSRAAVVGTAFGARVHARAMGAAGCDVIALVGRDPDRTQHRADRAGIPHACTTLDAALALEPSIVAIATPPHTHHALAQQALSAGCHVVCEKPFTLNLGQAEDLQSLVASSRLVGLLGHEFRFSESSALVGELLRSGSIGQPRAATFVAHGGLVVDHQDTMPEWWFDPAKGGGWLGASGSHAVDRVREWFGEVGAVSGRLTTVVGDRGPADDTFDAKLTTVSGVEVVLQSTAASKGPRTSVTTVVGTDATLWIEDEIGLGSIESAGGAVMLDDGSGPRRVEVPEDLVLRPRAGVPSAHERNVLPFARLYDSLLGLIEGSPPGARPHPASFADGVENMRVLDAIRRSSAAGGELVRLR